MVSPEGWVQEETGGGHAASAVRTYVDNGVTSCAGCHGADLAGGTAGISCYGNPAGCHHGTIPGWTASSPAVQGHGTAAKNAAGNSGFVACRICHGESFSGGGSQVSCLGCHGTGAPHAPGPWRGSGYTHATTAEAGNAPVCHDCHAYAGAANPNNPIVPAPPAAAGTAPGCFNGTMCHNDKRHAVPFANADHTSATAATYSGNCGGCHGVTGTSPASDAPLCAACHQAGSPLSAGGCTSCHANPPDGPSDAYPNAAGSHAAHAALAGAGTAVTCSSCHSGLGTGTLSHYNRANARPGKDALRTDPGDVAFPATFNALSGAASFSPSGRTCSNVICHGGQTTPEWRSAPGAIDVTNACLACHAPGTGQYNGYHSGEHGRHLVHFGFSASTCKRCHDVTKVNVTGHFQNLATTAFEQLPRNTLLGGLNYSYTLGRCKPSGLTGCHSTTRYW